MLPPAEFYSINHCEPLVVLPAFRIMYFPSRPSVVYNFSRVTVFPDIHRILYKRVTQSDFEFRMFQQGSHVIMLMYNTERSLTIGCHLWEDTWRKLKPTFILFQRFLKNRYRLKFRPFLPSVVHAFITSDRASQLPLEILWKITDCITHSKRQFNSTPLVRIETTAYQLRPAS